MKECDIQRLFGKYLNLQKGDSASYELKLSKTKSIRIDAVKDHQIQGLRRSQTGMYYKIQDMAATNGFANPKPFDCVWLKEIKGYVVICFYRPRKPKECYQIPVETWVKETAKVLKKSVTKDQIKTWPEVKLIIL